MSYQRPFLKWPGGKFKVLERILQYVKTPLRHWCEPFLGSGAVFLNAEAEHYMLADFNPHLINVYQTLQKEGFEFIRYVKKYFEPQWNTSEQYYDLRKTFNHTDSQLERAALFIYLNRHGFNGLCRYNQKGIFNVPFGSYRSPYFPEKEMRYFFEKSQRAVFSCQDFKQLLASSWQEKNSMVYCDPPYVPLSRSAAFTQYAAQGFSLQDHEDLALLANQHAASGTPVLVSNHDTPLVRKMYAGAQLDAFSVMRTISALNKGRKDVQEILALFLPAGARHCGATDHGCDGGETSRKS